MNKRQYKKRHRDVLSRMKLKHLVEWCNLYRRQTTGVLTKRKGLLLTPGISKMYIKFWKEHIAG